MTKLREARGDKVVETVTREYDRVVEFDDIVERVDISHDDWNGDPPWEQCDGWDHHARREGHYDHEGIRDARGYARCGRGDNRIIEIDDDDIVERWGCDGYHGASKQVRAEMIAQVKRRALDQLVKWYEDGWEYYVVSGEYHGCSDSLAGIDCWSYAEEVRLEVAGNIADQLEDDGFEVVGRPAPVVTHKLEWHRERIARNLKMGSICYE